MNLIDFVLGVDAPTLANAVELCQLRPNQAGFTPLEIRSLFPEMGRMAGYAVTAQVETVTQQEPFRAEAFLDLYELLDRSPKPAVIVLQEIGGYKNYAAHAGEVMSSIFQKLGAIGLVSDCAVRDLPEVRALGFQYFARGSVVSHANFRIARIGGSVQVEGMTVQPGDLIHGDENGILQIPSPAWDQLEVKVRQVRERERALLDFVRGPEFNLSKLREFIVE